MLYIKHISFPSLIVINFCSIDERVVFLVGLIISAFGFFVMIPMGDEKPVVGIERKLTSVINADCACSTTCRNKPR